MDLFVMLKREREIHSWNNVCGFREKESAVNYGWDIKRRNILK